MRGDEISMDLLAAGGKGGQILDRIKNPDCNWSANIL